ncbi:MAG: Fic family protein [Mycoplasmataceae bacterium]|jgi:Fic family protein|nr:Fic family protein [Mycoplasmataceae bacterium]
MVKRTLTLLKENKEFYEKIRQDFTYHSSTIEGSTVSYADHIKLSLIKKGETIEELNLSGSAKEDDIIENLNCLKLFDYVFNNLNKKLTHEEIKKYQFILKQDSNTHKNIPEETGEYRKTNMSAGKFEALPHYRIYQEMDNLLKDFEFRKHILIDDVSEFHIRYEAIHPFRDGNGRTGRMICFKQCLENNIIPFIVDEVTRNEYIDAVFIGETKYDYSYLIAYFLKQQKSFLSKYDNFLNNSKTTLSENENKVLSFLHTHTYASRLQIQEVVSLKERAAKTLIKSMVEKRLIISVGKGKNTRYVVS